MLASETQANGEVISNEKGSGANSVSRAARAEVIGEKIVDCNCPSRVPCKHSAAAIALHVHVAAHLANNIRKGDAH